MSFQIYFCNIVTLSHTHTLLWYSYHYHFSISLVKPAASDSGTLNERVITSFYGERSKSLRGILSMIVGDTARTITLLQDPQSMNIRM